MNTFTTPDRRSRDSELTALTGLHTAVRRRWQQLEDDISEVSSNTPRVNDISHRSNGVLRVRSDQSRSSSEVDAAEGDFLQTSEEEGQMEREVTGFSTEMEIRERSVVDQDDGRPRQRDQVRRIQGRQAWLELVRVILEERQRELHILSDHRSVSQFPHRARIQLLLRGRFLRNGFPFDEDRPPSLATGELCQLRQRHRVSGLREGFRFRLENIVRGQITHHSDTNNSSNEQFQFTMDLDPPTDNHGHSQTSIETNGINQVPETLTEGLQVANTDGTTLPESPRHGDESHVMSEWYQGSENTFSEWRGESVEQESDVNIQEYYQDWSNEIPEIDVIEDNEDWHIDSSVLIGVEAWQEEHFDTMTSEEFLPTRRVDRFIIPSDDESAYSVELRELVNRRSVSNLLSSEFRESLDQLIQSYVQRQGQSTIDWDVQESPLVQTEDYNQQEDDPNINQPDSVHQLPVASPLAIPLPPPLPDFHQERHHHWTRYMIEQRSEGNNVINDLRTEMARLQQGMNHMQRMLETCMDMQVEMQRSLKQELSAALGLSLDEQGSDVCLSSLRDGSKWSHVKKGMCFVCCVGFIDSLLYRCGHMCTCLKCAHELVESGKKCPLCQAPIVEVIRTYSIL